MPQTSGKNCPRLINTLPGLRLPLILTIAAGLLAINLVQTFQTVRTLQTKRRIRPYTFAGDQFFPVKDFLKNERRVGYWSDRSLDDRQTAALFAQAQYVLAPSILELNSTDLPFVIFDCRDKTKQITIIRDLGLNPLKVSPSGLVLAENPNIK